MFCLECGSDMVATRDAIIESYRGESFAVEGIEHLVCPRCGEYSLTADASRELSRSIAGQYAELHGLLRPDEILALRSKLGLSQAEFQRMLGVTGVAASRWETGRCQQSKSVDLLMRLTRDHECAARDLMEKAEVGGRRSISKGSSCTFSAHLAGKSPSVSFQERNASNA